MFASTLMLVAMPSKLSAKMPCCRCNFEAVHKHYRSGYAAKNYRSQQPGPGNVRFAKTGSFLNFACLASVLNSSSPIPLLK